VPNIKAAVKWVRQSEKRTQRNLDVKTRLKTLYKKAVSAQDAEVVRSVEAQFDKAAQKGIVHPNKAARKKSRMAKAAAKAAGAAAAAPTTGKKKTSK
jgi:small subunit ribosomal protein S20